MTPEAQRISIAEALGWMCLGGCFLPDYSGWVLIGDESWKGGMRPLPDYLNDLNAIHSAEMTLTDEELDELFYYWLGFVVSGGQETNLWKWRKTIVHANAAQRSEAFLRTLGKWIETVVDELSDCR